MPNFLETLNDANGWPPTPLPPDSLFYILVGPNSENIDHAIAFETLVLEVVRALGTKANEQVLTADDGETYGVKWGPGGGGGGGISAADAITWTAPHTFNEPVTFNGGNVTVASGTTPTELNHLAPKGYVDAGDAALDAQMSDFLADLNAETSGRIFTDTALGGLISTLQSEVNAFQGVEGLVLVTGGVPQAITIGKGLKLDGTILTAVADLADILAIVARYESDFGLYNATTGGAAVTADVGTIKRWEDSVGNKHLTQATTANAPAFDAEKGLICSQSLDGKNQGFVFPAGLSIDRRNFTAVFIGEFNSLRTAYVIGGPAYYRVLLLGSGGFFLGVDCADNASPNNGKLLGSPATTRGGFPFSSRCMIAFVGTANELRIWVNDDYTDATALTAGDSDLTSMMFYTGDFFPSQMSLHTFALYDRALSDTEMLSVPWKYAHQVAGVPRIRANQILLDADSNGLGVSLTSATANVCNRNFASLLPESFPNMGVRNFALAGSSIQQAKGWYDTQIAPCLIPGEINILIIGPLGGNDIDASISAATVLADYASYISGLRALAAIAGAALKIIPMEISPRNSYSAGEITAYQAVNTTLNADWDDRNYDTPPIDATSDPLDDPTDLVYYSDGIHFTNAMHAILATRAATRITLALTQPSLVTPSINTDGDELTLLFQEPVAGHTGFSITASGGAAGITYVSGDGTNTYIFSIDRVINGPEVVTITYAPGNVEDAVTLVNLIRITASHVVNNSTQGTAPSNWTFLDSVKGASATGPAVATTTAMDTTNADLLVAWVQYYDGVGDFPGITDSVGETWIPLTLRDGNSIAGRMFYCLNPTGNAAHTFSNNPAGTYPAASLEVLAFSGPAVFEAEAGGVEDTVATPQPGSLTPSVNDALIIQALGGQTSFADPPGLTGGYTITDTVVGVGGVNQPSSIAYLIQAVAAATNPTWTVAAQHVTKQAAVFIPV